MPSNANVYGQAKPVEAWLDLATVRVRRRQGQFRGGANDVRQRFLAAVPQAFGKNNQSSLPRSYRISDTPMAVIILVDNRLIHNL